MTITRWASEIKLFTLRESVVRPITIISGAASAALIFSSARNNDACACAPIIESGSSATTGQSKISANSWISSAEKPARSCPTIKTPAEATAMFSFADSSSSRLMSENPANQSL